jgi:hypothetical protein
LLSLVQLGRAALQEKIKIWKSIQTMVKLNDRSLTINVNFNFFFVKIAQESLLHQARIQQFWKRGPRLLFEIFFRTTQELEYLFFLPRKALTFFPEFNNRLYDKNSESDYFFFLQQNQNIFFSNIGNQNIFFRKKT